MFKKLAVIGIAAAIWGGVWGCGELAEDPEIAKLIPAARVLQGTGTASGGTRQQDRLRDGTGANCLDGASQGARGQGVGQGTGEKSRLRDGSCLP